MKNYHRGVFPAFQKDHKSHTRNTLGLASKNHFEFHLLISIFWGFKFSSFPQHQLKSNMKIHI